MFRFFAFHSIAAVLLSLSILASGCGGEDPPGAEPTGQTPTTSTATPARSAVTVHIQDFKYKPATVTVQAGGEVTWTNRDAAKHNSQTNPKAERSFNTGDITQGNQETVTFTAAGSFKYYCIYHRFMNGTVKVVK